METDNQTSLNQTLKARHAQPKPQLKPEAIKLPGVWAVKVLLAAGDHLRLSFPEARPSQGPVPPLGEAASNRALTIRRGQTPASPISP